MPATEKATRHDKLSGVSICLVAINYAPDSTGIAPYNEAMAKAWRDAGADVHVVTGVPHYPQWAITDETYLHGTRWDEVLDGIRVTRLKHHVPATPGLVGRARMESSFLSRARPVVRADASQIVVAVTPSLAGLAAGRYGKRGRPFGALVQDLTGNAAGQSGTTGGAASRAIASFEYSQLRKATLVGVITPQFGTVLEHHGIAREALVDLPNFTHITPVASDKSAARARLGWPEDGYLVVHTGNMGRKQGLENVVDAARESERLNLGINFVLVGDGNQRRELRAAGEGVSTLRFVDPLSTSDFPFALAAADTLLLNERPGVKEMSLPSKLTSYTSASRPIIAAVEPAGITHQIVTADDAALTIDPGVASALLDAAVTLRDDPQQSARLAEQAWLMHETRYSAAEAKDRYVEFARNLGSLA